MFPKTTSLALDSWVEMMRAFLVFTPFYKENTKMTKPAVKQIPLLYIIQPTSTLLSLAIESIQ